MFKIRTPKKIQIPKSKCRIRRREISRETNHVANLLLRRHGGPDRQGDSREQLECPASLSIFHHAAPSLELFASAALKFSHVLRILMSRCRTGAFVNPGKQKSPAQIRRAFFLHGTTLLIVLDIYSSSSGCPRGFRTIPGAPQQSWLPAKVFCLRPLRVPPEFCASDPARASGRPR